MPRTYLRRLGAKPKRNYNTENLIKAIQAIKVRKLSYRQAAEKYQIPRSTLENKVNLTHPKSLGGQPVLTKEEEGDLVHGILRAAHWGFPFTGWDIRYLVKGYLDRCGQKEKRFCKNMPGEDWVKSFLKRHSDILTTRLSENIKRARAEVSSETIKCYFDNIRPIVEQISPGNLINYDETNLVVTPARSQLLVKPGPKLQG